MSPEHGHIPPAGGACVGKINITVFVGTGEFSDVGMVMRVGSTGCVSVGRFVEVMAIVGRINRAVCVDAITAVWIIPVEIFAVVGVALFPPMISDRVIIQMQVMHEAKRTTAAIIHLLLFLFGPVFCDLISDCPLLFIV